MSAMRVIAWQNGSRLLTGNPALYTPRLIACAPPTDLGGVRLSV